MYDDPIAAYAEISAALQPGQKYTQSGFDYEGLPTKRVEELYPIHPMFDADGSNSYEVSQGGLSDCVLLSRVCALAEAKNKYQIKDLIYPLTVSPIGLYFISVAQGLGRKWLPFDSSVPLYNDPTLWYNGRPRNVDIQKQNPVLWPMLMEKGTATIRGKYSQLDAGNIQNPYPGWVPIVRKMTKTFAEVLSCIAEGGYGGISFTQPKDASGNPVSVPGVYLGHEHSLLDAFEYEGAQAVRISNPWGGADDLVGSPQFADDSPFWDLTPELKAKGALTKGRGGEYWISYSVLCSYMGKSDILFEIPLPWSKYPVTKTFDVEFTDATGQLFTDWPNQNELMAIAGLHGQYEIEVLEPTEFYAQTFWGQGATGSRHSFFMVFNDADKSNKYAASRLPGDRGWWGRPSWAEGLLMPGKYRVYPATVSRLDRGKLSTFLLGSKPFNLRRNGEAIAP
jgi:Calpain family cysteine protease